MALSRSGAVFRDRAIFLSGAAIVTALSWLYLVRMTPDMSPGGVTHHGGVHEPADFAVAFAMWTVMMIAMMLPSALPFVMAFAGEQQHRKTQQFPYVPAGVFVAGYFAIWTAFSAVAALIQVALHRAALLSPLITTTNSVFAGVMLMAAGVYQWTPLKNACLRHCRSPLTFLLSDWHGGVSGAFRMGVEHGLFCIGCCWLLMALPLATGMMNLLWMAAITVFLLVEKAAPGGQWFGRIAGAGLAAAGAWFLLLALRH